MLYRLSMQQLPQLVPARVCLCPDAAASTPWLSLTCLPAGLSLFLLVVWSQTGFQAAAARVHCIVRKNQLVNWNAEIVFNIRFVHNSWYT